MTLPWLPDTLFVESLPGCLVPACSLKRARPPPAGLCWPQTSLMPEWSRQPVLGQDVGEAQGWGGRAQFHPP